MVCCTNSDIMDMSPDFENSIIEDLGRILPLIHMLWQNQLYTLFSAYKEAGVPCPFEDEKKHLKAFYMKAAKEYARLLEKEAANA